MTHYKLYSLHLGCGEPLATQYQPVQVPVAKKRYASKKQVKVKTSQVTGRKRK
jgi:hypothetical protein